MSWTVETVFVEFLSVNAKTASPGQVKVTVPVTHVVAELQKFFAYWSKVGAAAVSAVRPEEPPDGEREIGRAHV